MMFQYSDEELLEGLRQREGSYIDYLYLEFYPLVRHHVIQNSGNLQDVDDVIQETMTVLYKRCIAAPLRLECSLKTYFMSICKNLWLQSLERNCRLLYQADYAVHETQGEYTLEEQCLKDESMEQQRLFYKHLMLLPNECRRLLQLYCLKIPYKEIARLLKYKDETYVKTRKYSCKQLLRRKIMNDPECQQFLIYHGNRNQQRLD
jgi:RNA polymerase sigma factor (sigma-70 family)